MWFLYRIFIITLFVLPACKQKKPERNELHLVSLDTMIKIENDTVKKAVEVLKVVKVPDDKNKILDSVVIFGSLDIEYNTKLIDSIIVHFKAKKVECIYRRDKADFTENQIAEMYFDKEQNCFAHFNNDNFTDLYFSNIYGGSGGRTYSVFLLNHQKLKFKYQPLLSGFFNLCYNKISNHYVSIGKSGSDRLAIRFEIRKDTIKELSRLGIDFLKGGSTIYDTLMIKYTYEEPTKKSKIEVCYFFTDRKSEKEIKKCSKFMQNTEKKMWEDWKML